MKNKFLKFTAFLLILVVFFSACKKTETEEEYKNPYRDNIIGQWKLINAWSNVDYSQLDTTDYSEENIIFDFQENNKLVVKGNIPDALFVFDDFQGGEHFYEYQKLNVCPTCKPGPNLFIDQPKLGSFERNYFCFALLSEKNMNINKNGWMTDGDEGYSLSINFVKLN